MDLGNGFGIAKRGGTNLDTGHEKTERKRGMKKRKDRHCRRKRFFPLCGRLLQPLQNMLKTLQNPAFTLSPRALQHAFHRIAESFDIPRYAMAMEPGCDGPTPLADIPARCARARLLRGRGTCTSGGRPLTAPRLSTSVTVREPPSRSSGA